MTVLYSVSQEAETENATTNWVEKLLISGDLQRPDPPTGMMIHVYCEYAGSAANKTVAVQVLLDGVQVAYAEGRSVSAFGYMSFSGMGLKDFDNGTHTISLQSKCIDAGASVRIRRARILVIQH